MKTTDAAARERARGDNVGAKPTNPQSEPAPDNGQQARPGEARSLDAVTPGGAPYKTRELGKYQRKG